MSSKLTIFVDCGAVTALGVVRDDKVLDAIELKGLKATALQRRFDAIEAILDTHGRPGDEVLVVCEAPWGGLQVNTYGVLMQHVGAWRGVCEFLDLKVGDTVSPGMWRAAWGIPANAKREVAKEAAMALVRELGLWSLPTKRADNIAEAVLGALYVDRERHGVTHSLRKIKVRRPRKRKVT